MWRSPLASLQRGNLPYKKRLPPASLNNFPKSKNCGTQSKPRGGTLKHTTPCSKGTIQHHCGDCGLALELSLTWTQRMDLLEPTWTKVEPNMNKQISSGQRKLILRRTPSNRFDVKQMGTRWTSFRVTATTGALFKVPTILTPKPRKKSGLLLLRPCDEIWPGGGIAIRPFL